MSSVLMPHCLSSHPLISLHGFPTTFIPCTCFFFLKDGLLVNLEVFTYLFLLQSEAPQVSPEKLKIQKPQNPMESPAMAARKRRGRAQEDEEKTASDEDVSKSKVREA